MNNYYIYFHINETSGEVFYVGKGKGKRAWHKSGRNQYWKNIVKKYGYRVDIIHTDLSEKRAFDWEKLYISMFGRENLCNLTDGGDGSSGAIRSDDFKLNLKIKNSGENNPFYGKKHSEETIKKFSNSLKGKISPRKGYKFTEEELIKHSEIRKGKTSWNKGLKWSEESKIKMSKSQKGKKLSEQHKINIGLASKGREKTSNKEIEIDGVIYKSRKEAYDIIKPDCNYSNFCRKVRNETFTQ